MSWRNERSRNGGVDEVPVPVGRLWLAGKHFVGPDPEDALRRIGAGSIVCLNEAHEIAHRYPHYVEWLAVNAPDRSVWWPIPDLHAPPLDEVEPLLDDLLSRLRRGDGLLVHCGAGIGRAGTIAAALLVSMGAGLADALDAVAGSRPMAGPEAGAQAALLDAVAARGVDRESG